MVIDVQGHEEVIIRQIKDISRKPKFLIFEDEFRSSKKSKQIDLLLSQYGYRYMFGFHDKVYRLAEH